MRKFTNQEITEIRKSIKKGTIYVPVYKNGKAFGGAIFHSPYPSKFISWRYYGQSAIKDTDEQLRWLLETIFDDCEDITEAVWNEYLIDYVPLKDELVLDRERQPHMKLDNIKIEGRVGTWYDIDHLTHNGVTYVLFESEIWGGDAPAVVIKYTDDRTNKREIPKKDEVGETFDSIDVFLGDEDIL